LQTPLIFVLGKGGVGKTSASYAMAKHNAQLGKKSLIVQWSLADSAAGFTKKSSPFNLHSQSNYDENHQFQKETELEQGIYTVNYSFQETLREYFVEHLKQKILHSLVVENKHVQKLLQASPGVQELFFLGRIFWLIDLAEEERGWKYDHVIVDSPSTGHGSSLFGLARSIGKFGLTGPLGEECRRVQGLLDNPKKTGYVIVTLPEELPIQESRELTLKVKKEIGYGPLCFFLNRHISQKFYDQYSEIKHEMDNFLPETKEILSVLNKSYSSSISLASEFKKEREEDFIFIPEASLEQKDILECWLSSFQSHIHARVFST
jgi:Anion-transporting ATPase